MSQVLGLAQAVESPEISLGSFAHGILGSHWRQLLKGRQALLMEDGPESLHQLRVTVRRLRASLDLFGLAVDIPKQGRPQKLKKLGSALGQQRDLDVIMQTLVSTYRPQLPDQEQHWLDCLTRDMAKQYPKARRQSHKLLQSKDFAKIEATWCAWVQSPVFTEQGSYPLGQSLPLLLLPALRDLVLHPAWQLELQFSQDPAFESAIGHLHSLRKAIKRFRYQLEVSGDFYSSPIQGWIQHLKSLQDHLGQLTDDQILRTQLADLLPEGVDLPQVDILSHLLREESLHFWQQSQRQYQDPEFIKTLYRQLLDPILGQENCQNQANLDPALATD